MARRFASPKGPGRRRARQLAVLVAAAAVALAPAVATVSAPDPWLPPPLLTLEGTLTLCPTGHCVGNRPVEFGDSALDPKVASSLVDLIEPLIGSTVRVEVTREGAEVYSLNGIPWPTQRGPSATPATKSPRTPAPGTPLGGDYPDPADRLQTLEGTLTNCRENWCVDGVEVNFGPWWYLRFTPVDDGFDLPDTAHLIDLLASMVSRQVRVEVDPSNNVYSLNEKPWRPVGEKPPWAGGPFAPKEAAPEPPSEGPPEKAGGPPTTLPDPVPEQPGGRP
jgi:hypothetical protein